MDCGFAGEHLQVCTQSGATLPPAYATGHDPLKIRLCHLGSFVSNDHLLLTMEEGDGSMMPLAEAPDREEQERREDCVILEALAAQVRDDAGGEQSQPRQQFASALARCWGTKESVLPAIALHLATTIEEVLHLMKTGQEKDSLVIELSISFPGLNLACLNYLVAISTSSLLLVQCRSCTHPPGAVSLQVEHDRDAEFGFSISALFDIVATHLPSISLQLLSDLLRAAHVFFWPLARVDQASLCMERTALAASKPETPAEVVRLEKTGRRKMRGGKTVVGGSTGISLVGLHTPTVLWRSNQQARKRKLDIDQIATTELRTADRASTLENSGKTGNLLIRKVTEKMIPIADIHARIPQCETKYTYYGTHDHILDDDEAGKEEEPLLYDDTGRLKLSQRQQEVLNRLVATIGTGTNNWSYCCWIFFKKFHNFVPTGRTRYEKDVLEVYLKMQYFGSLKKVLRTNEFSREELNQIRILLKYFWGNSTVICNHFARRSHESVCKEMERMQRRSRLEECFVISVRVRPLQLQGTEEKLLEQLQEEVSVLVAGDVGELYLLPCLHSSIVCPHRTFPRLPEITFHCDFEVAGKEQEFEGNEQDRFMSFLMGAANAQLSSVLARAFHGPTLANLIRTHQRNLFRLPCNTLFRLNGAKRLRDAGFKMVEQKPEVKP